MLTFQFYTPNQAAYLIREEKKKKKKVKLGQRYIRLHNFNNFRTFENLASK